MNMAVVANMLMAALAGAIVGMIYCMPTIIAVWHQHPQHKAITALNILLGWTFLGWAGALVWAVMGRRHYGYPGLRTGLVWVRHR